MGECVQVCFWKIILHFGFRASLTVPYPMCCFQFSDSLGTRGQFNVLFCPEPGAAALTLQGKGAPEGSTGTTSALAQSPGSRESWPAVPGKGAVNRRGWIPREQWSGEARLRSCGKSCLCPREQGRADGSHPTAKASLLS